MSAARLEFAVRLRVADDAATALAQSGRVAYYRPVSGKEGVLTGLAFGLEPGDWVFAEAQAPDGGALDWASDRGLRWVAGASPSAARLGHTMGAAWAAKLRGDAVVAATVFGPGAEDSPDYHTALNFAGVYEVPAIFVCATPDAPSAEEVRHRGEAYGLAAALTDGDDAEAVVDAIRQAASRARAGRGATLVVAPYGRRDALQVAARSAGLGSDAARLGAVVEKARADAHGEARRAISPAASDAFYLREFRAVSAPNPD